MWGPPVISWFINPVNYSYKYHKPWLSAVMSACLYLFGVFIYLCNYLPTYLLFFPSIHPSIYLWDVGYVYCRGCIEFIVLALSKSGLKYHSWPLNMGNIMIISDYPSNLARFLHVIAKKIWHSEPSLSDADEEHEAPDGDSADPHQQ